MDKEYKSFCQYKLLEKTFSGDVSVIILTYLKEINQGDYFRKTLINNILHGPSFTYFTEVKETIQNKVVYVNGKKEGLEIWYNRNGSEKAIFTYKDNDIKRVFFR
jgi:antitoxin component YwqK of YwqJK toxin-antitoxin module